MWDAYTAGAESLVIVTSVKALNRFLPADIMKFPVKYHGSEYERSEFGWNTLSFYKPACYAFEREFRLLRCLKEDETVTLENSADFGRLVPVRLKNVLHRVIAHPLASQEFKLKLDNDLMQILKSVHREDSSLEQ
jgi:hypothetical protein